MKVEHRRNRRLSSRKIILLNLIFLIIVVVTFFIYRADYKTKLYQQNVSDVNNINQSAANIASNYFDSQTQKLSDIVGYQQLHQMPLQECMQYIIDSDNGGKVSFEIVGVDSIGWRVNEGDHEIQAVDYSHTDYKEMQDLFEKVKDPEYVSIDQEPIVKFSPEFTDNATGFQSFAIYTYLLIPDEQGELSAYTLMEVIRSDKVIDMINLDEGGYQDLSTILVNQNGDYIISNDDYNALNFFQYLYLYNELSMDYMNDLQQKMVAEKTGTLEFKNTAGEKCVYVYAQVPDTQWYSITGVPISSFRRSTMDWTFTLLLMLILLFMLIMDITWLTELNKRLKASAQEARQASEAKTDFLSRMSHDIRTPINVITGMTELAMGEDNSPTTTEYLNNIRSSGTFLLGLVNDILDLNKVESGKMELHPRPYTYQEFERYIQAVILPLCQKKGITFHMECDSPNIVIYCDSLRLNQIIFNLLSNAVKFTQPGGHIQLLCQWVRTPDGQTGARFIASDDGVGMSKEFQQRMFEAFSQESKEYATHIQGTGLGLAIVKNIVELMDGEMQVESEEGKGTTFTIYIPTEVTESEEQRDQSVYDKSVLEGKRVLLCEDHPLNTQIVVRLLQKRGVIIECAENGAVGLDMVKDAEEYYYDVILMDIQMPVMNGLDAMKAIRAMEHRQDVAKLPMIALTANAYDTDIQNCIDAGANAHLAKPINSELLYQTLARFL